MLDYIEMYNLKKLKKVVTRTRARTRFKKFFSKKRRFNLKKNMTKKKLTVKKNV